MCTRTAICAALDRFDGVQDQVVDDLGELLGAAERDRTWPVHLFQQDASLGGDGAQGAECSLDDFAELELAEGVVGVTHGAQAIARLLQARDGEAHLLRELVEFARDRVDFTDSRL